MPSFLDILSKRNKLEPKQAQLNSGGVQSVNLPNLNNFLGGPIQRPTNQPGSLSPSRSNTSAPMGTYTKGAQAIVARKTVIDRAVSGVDTRAGLLEGIAPELVPYLERYVGSKESLAFVTQGEKEREEMQKRYRMITMGLLNSTPGGFGKPNTSAGKLLGN